MLKKIILLIFYHKKFMKIEDIQITLIQIVKESIKDQEIEINIKNVDSELELYGSDGVFDSLGLVNFISDAEEVISEIYKINLTLADDRAMSLRNSPFKNIKTLSEYILLQLNNHSE